MSQNRRDFVPNLQSGLSRLIGLWLRLRIRNLSRLSRSQIELTERDMEIEKDVEGVVESEEESEDKSNSQSLLHIAKEEQCLYELKKEESEK